MKSAEIITAYRNFVNKNHRIPNVLVINPKDYMELRYERYCAMLTLSFADKEATFMGVKIREDCDCKSFEFRFE
ncbi:hypothetical protein PHOOPHIGHTERS_32 [Serratia phage vB_SmaS_PhooPhighters]|uniref:Uncharacterized protein n=1 Tax=Serratia phage vB_SmaS_Rovert TaxID=2777363 RepID=A0A7T3TKV9_9CAUD|nr:hypothetical protein QJS24_gp25 [Serratia phage vB_SmaS_Rovert]QPX74993.1 hypothetical protein [Serratia phage vB_SmaS_Rovert]UGO51966.1 hypothetical protein PHOOPHIGHTERS_32 [Serratia phage vB_SmaS_PhooPhighters]